MKQVLGHSDAEKAFRPWWDSFEDYLIYSLILLGNPLWLSMVWLGNAGEFSITFNVKKCIFPVTVKRENEALNRFYFFWQENLNRVSFKTWLVYAQKLQQGARRPFSSAYKSLIYKPLV